MVKKSDRLQTVVDLAEQELEQAGQTLHAVQNQLEQTQFQINSLKQYLQEIATAPTTIDGTATFQAFHFKNTHVFIHKVQEALLQEQDKEGQLSQAVEKAREAWLEKRARVKGLQKVQQNLVKKEEKQVQRQEQRALDDLTNSRGFIGGCEKS